MNAEETFNVTACRLIVIYLSGCWIFLGGRGRRSINTLKAAKRWVEGSGLRWMCNCLCTTASQELAWQRFTLQFTHMTVLSAVLILTASFCSSRFGHSTNELFTEQYVHSSAQMMNAERTTTRHNLWFLTMKRKWSTVFSLVSANRRKWRFNHQYFVRQKKERKGKRSKWISTVGRDLKEFG